MRNCEKAAFLKRKKISKYLYKLFIARNENGSINSIGSYQ